MKEKQEVIDKAYKILAESEVFTSEDMSKINIIENVLVLNKNYESIYELFDVNQEELTKHLLKFQKEIEDVDDMSEKINKAKNNEYVMNFLILSGLKFQFVKKNELLQSILEIANHHDVTLQLLTKLLTK